jgi:hypothetical protein
MLSSLVFRDGLAVGDAKTQRGREHELIGAIAKQTNLLAFNAAIPGFIEHIEAAYTNA